MITGRCECGKVTYQVDGKISDYSHCHCGQCRRTHGAAFASYATVQRKDFTYLTGESELKHYPSSVQHERVFCSNCGSNIMFIAEDEPSEYFITMGSIDGDPDLPTAYHIFVASKAPWYEITDNLKQFDTNP
ncbi:MAG: GFA family protein [Gammaproteobacteria bacterium]|nr:MAG: GFA family protein [Gammaproteobacteria bacterium]